MATGHWTPIRRYLHRLAEPALTDAQLLGRFRTNRDEEAFEVLVRRHGPLVQGVCHRVLRDWHTAQDAFQAVFLILARKAATLEQPEALGPWLYGVAYRTALKARATAARRLARETWPLADVATADSTEEVDWRDLRCVLDDEINRLPGRYRKPFVWSYLQGKTNAEVARLLGCSRGTVATLLARARQRLRQRLTRRGLTLSAALAASTVPAALSVSTARAAVLFAAGHPNAVGGLTGPAATLAQGVLRAMMANKLKLGAIVLVAFGVLGMGAGIATYQAGAGEPDRPTPPSVLAPAVAAPPVTPVAKAVYGTANFEVTAPSLDVARQVGQAAERHRSALARLWLNNLLPDWSTPCPIHVKLTGQASAGATSFALDGGRVTGRDMHLEGKLQGILADALPHEVTHIVLADHFGKPVPRWADEGAAILAESVVSQDRHLAVLGEALTSGGWFHLKWVLPVQDFPREVTVWNAEGYSLTRFLIRKDRQTFLRFIAQGEKDGWERAVRDCYGYSSIAELEKAWLRQARKESPRPLARSATTAAASPHQAAFPSPHGSLPTGPAPAQALVTLGKGGQLDVWQSVLSYEPRTLYQPARTPGEAARSITSYTAVTRLGVVRYKLDEVRVYDHEGKPIPVSELPKRLQGETLALVATGPGPVDPLHLRLIKPGTLVFVVPMPPAVIPPPAFVPTAAPPVPAPPITAPQTAAGR